MKMTGEQRIAAPRQRVWDALNDPDVLRASIPGCQSLDKEADDRFTATVEVKVGPIGARFKGAVTLTDVDAPNGYTLVIQGNGGIAGSMKGSARVRLSDDGGGTLIVYDVDAEVGGRMAQLGGPIIDATAKQLAGKFFRRLGEIVGGVQADEQPASAALTAGAATNGTAATQTASATKAAPTRAASPPAASTTRTGLPMAWILATVVAVLAGFLVGRGQGIGGSAGAGSEWIGIAIGLLLIVVAGAAFEYGRRVAAPVLTLDAALLRRLLAAAEPGDRP